MSANFEACHAEPDRSSAFTPAPIDEKEKAEDQTTRSAIVQAAAAASALGNTVAVGAALAEPSVAHALNESAPGLDA